MQPDVLILARSGRQLAAAALQAGYVPAVIDFFGDSDTRAVSALTLTLTPRSGFTFPAALLLDRVQGVFAEHGPMPVVCGSGFEAQTHVLAAIAARASLAGCPAAVVAACKDPVRVARRLDEIGIQSAPPHYGSPPGGGLRKRRGGCGGDHVRFAPPGSIPGQREYFQEFLEGVPFSAAFVATGADTRVLGLCEPLEAFERTTVDFSYAGAISAPDLYERIGDRVSSIVSGIAARFGLIGLCGIDFLLTRDDDVRVVDINPRPTATFDLLARPGDVFDAHVRATAGSDPELHPYADVRASALCTADRSFTVPGGLDFPSWCADRPRPGTVIAAGMPICSVYAARAGDRAQTQAVIAERRAFVRRLVAGDDVQERVQAVGNDA